VREALDILEPGRELAPPLDHALGLVLRVGSFRDLLPLANGVCTVPIGVISTDRIAVIVTRRGRAGGVCSFVPLDRGATSASGANQDEGKGTVRLVGE
jgi:hypothetical protein